MGIADLLKVDYEKTEFENAVYEYARSNGIEMFRLLPSPFGPVLANINRNNSGPLIIHYVRELNESTERILYNKNELSEKEMSILLDPQNILLEYVTITDKISEGWYKFVSQIEQEHSNVRFKLFRTYQHGRITNPFEVDIPAINQSLPIAVCFDTIDGFRKLDF